MEITGIRKNIGGLGEKIASEFLVSRGYGILGRNYRKPWGELDLICEKSGTIVFVEVKTNSSSSENFQPEIRGDWKKMRKVARTARSYLAQKNYPPEQEWQIDLISITFFKEKGTAKIKHFKNIEI